MTILLLKVQRCVVGSPIVLILAASLCAGFVNTAASQTPAVDEVMKAVLQGLDHRQDQLNPIWVKFEVRFQETKDWKTMRSKGPSVKDRAGQLAEFAHKGNRKWWKVLNNDPDLSPWERETFLLYNGEIEIAQSNRENEYLISRNPSGNHLAEPPSSLVGEDSLRTILKEWKNGKRTFAKVTATETLEHGETLIVLEILFPPPGWRNKYWLLSDKDYMVRRSEVYDGNRQPIDKAETKEISSETGISFPIRGKKDHYMGGGKFAYTVEFQVTSIETKANRIPESLFSFEFPEDASVYDEDLKVFVRNADLTESHLAEVIRRAGGHRNLWTQWWFLSAGALVLLAIAAGIVRWRRKAR